MADYTGAHTGAEIDDAVGVTKGSGTGIIAKTATGTGAKRTITGTADEITVTNGDGVSGNPTLSLATAATDSLALADSAVQPGDNISTLSNDAGYLAPSDNVSDLTNDAGYLTASDDEVVMGTREVTSSATLTASDFDGTYDMIVVNSASDVVLTVPPSLTPTHPLAVFRKGLGEVDIAAGAGVTILSESSYLSIDSQYTAASLSPTGTSDEYALVGALKA